MNYKLAIGLVLLVAGSLLLFGCTGQNNGANGGTGSNANVPAGGNNVQPAGNGAGNSGGSMQASGTGASGNQQGNAGAGTTVTGANQQSGATLSADDVGDVSGDQDTPAIDDLAADNGS